MKPKLDIERAMLPNGLTVLLAEKHATPAVSINAYVRAGSRYEPDGRAGLAALAGELLDDGTQTRDARQIAETVEAVGGQLRTFGNYQASGAQVALLAEDAPLGLEVIADLLTSATFPEEKVRQQAERTAAQIKSRLDVPRVLASDAFNEIVFAGHPAHRPSIGYEETVLKLTREEVVGFYHQYYIPNNTILAIAGDIDKAQTLRRVEDLLGGWEPRAGFQPPAVPRPQRQAAPVERLVNAPKEQVNIFIGHLGVERRHPDYYALLVMDKILGSSPGFTSRIPRILRDEQGLAYTTFSNVTSSAGLDPGRFVAYIGTSPDNLGAALVGLRREIRRIVEEPVTGDELRGAADYLTGSFVFDFQTGAQVAEFMIEAEIYGLGFDYPERYPELIRQIGVDDVWQATRRHIDPDNLTTVVVGPL